MNDPLAAHRSNVTGFLNMLIAARDAKVKRLVYASSSAIYGDDPGLPKVEAKVGRPLSPVRRYEDDQRSLCADVCNVLRVSFHWTEVF